MSDAIATISVVAVVVVVDALIAEVGNSAGGENCEMIPNAPDDAIDASGRDGTRRGGTETTTAGVPWCRHALPE